MHGGDVCQNWEGRLNCGNFLFPHTSTPCLAMIALRLSIILDFKQGTKERDHGFVKSVVIRRPGFAPSLCSLGLTIFTVAQSLYLTQDLFGDEMCLKKSEFALGSTKCKEITKRLIKFLGHIHVKKVSIDRQDIIWAD